LMTDQQMLELMAGTSPSRAQTLAPSMANLRASSPTDSTLAVVTAPPLAKEVALLSRIGATFGRKIAVFVYPVNPSVLSVDAAARGRSRGVTAAARGPGGAGGGAGGATREGKWRRGAGWGGRRREGGGRRRPVRPSGARGGLGGGGRPFRQRGPPLP